MILYTWTKSGSDKIVGPRLVFLLGVSIAGPGDAWQLRSVFEWVGAQLAGIVSSASSGEVVGHD